ncbi:hypothetical protein [Salipiger sp.]|uniref:hypothetical protein n=1 Tax=Salipiger sp. TaxID=2078585 RepID=UPI003A986D25
MPTLYLHVGLHKTGTTTLQKTLHDNQDALARQGVLYPRTGLSQQPANWGHHELSYALRKRETAQEMWTALRREADAAALPKLVVSSEEFSLLPGPGLPGAEPFKLIAKFFEGYEIRLICYLRPQSELIASLYNHNVKSVGEQSGIMEFIARVAPRLEYHNYLNIAALGLGGAKTIIVRRYQKVHMTDGDIVADMAELIGVDASGFRRPKAPLNSGLTAEGMAHMLEANRRHADNPTRLKIARKRILDQHLAPPFYRHELLSAEAQQLIEAIYRYKNRHIARHYLGLDGELFPTQAGSETENAV